MWIANTAPTITVTCKITFTPKAINPSLTVINAGQVTPTLSASVGNLAAHGQQLMGLEFTRNLAIADSDTKGAANFTGLSITNLAGIEVTNKLGLKYLF